jgi:integrase
LDLDSLRTRLTFVRIFREFEFNQISNDFRDRLKTRNRRPIKPATAAAFEAYLRNHVVPGIGNVELESFNNGALKSFVQTLIDKKLAPKSIAEISAFTRSIVASVLDADGNQVYPRSWNMDFVDAPPVQQQHQPTVTKKFLQSVLQDDKIKIRNRVLLALLASTGLRIGELQALQIGPDPLDQNTVWNSDERIIRVRKSIWRGRAQEPKTVAAVRYIDLSLATNEMLKKFANGRLQGELLFRTKSGKPLAQNFINTYILKPAGIPGAHSLRRFRTSNLRSMGCNESVLRYWLGHTGDSVTDLYDKSAEDVELRRAWSEKVGTGLDLSLVTIGGPTSVTKPKHVTRAKSTEPVADISTNIPRPYVAQDCDLDEFFLSTPELVPKEA